MVSPFFPHGAAFCDFGATWFYSDYGLMVLVKKKDQPGEKLVFKVFHNNTSYDINYYMIVRSEFDSSANKISLLLIVMDS